MAVTRMRFLRRRPCWLSAARGCGKGPKISPRYPVAGLLFRHPPPPQDARRDSVGPAGALPRRRRRKIGAIRRTVREVGILDRTTFCDGHHIGTGTLGPG